MQVNIGNRVMWTRDDGKTARGAVLRIGKTGVVVEHLDTLIRDLIPADRLRPGCQPDSI